jgi:hypothetical protein
MNSELSFIYSKHLYPNSLILYNTIAASCSVYKYGWTALIMAAQIGYCEICSLLVERGANIDEKDNVSDGDVTFYSDYRNLYAVVIIAYLLYRYHYLITHYCFLYYLGRSHSFI